MKCISKWNTLYPNNLNFEKTPAVYFSGIFTREAGKVNISGETYKFVSEYFECEYRGKIEAKNKGEIDMYFVHRLKPKYAEPGSTIKPNKDFMGILSEY